MRHPIRTTVAMTLACLPLRLSAQKPIALDKPEAELKDPFSQIASVRELRDGRVLVADPRDRRVQLVDFRSGTAVRVGREGPGPGEYAVPQRIMALPGDSSAIYDQVNQRYLLVRPDGTVGEHFRLEEAAATTAGRGFGRGAVARGSDSRGRIFSQGSPFAPTPGGGGMMAVDSAPVLRYDRATRRTDTVAYVQLAKGNAGVSGGQGMVQLRVGQQAFPAHDEWVATADGGVAVVRVRDYHVDRYSASGSLVSGPPVTVDAIPVTEADKEEWRAARRALVGQGMQQGRGGGTTMTGAPPPRPDPEFPAFKPPFVPMGVFARPNGDVWVLRSRKAGDAIPVYDVFDATGKMIARIAFPAKTRLVGFGNGTIYAARSDEDDLEYLQRYRAAGAPGVSGGR
jgi:hypothetical protein